MLPVGNNIRASAGAPPVASVDEFMRRAPLMLVASGKPFEYPQTNWGDAVQMIGPCMFEPAMDTVPDWLTAIDRPIVLVTTSSQKQADAKLVVTAMTALADEPVHVVATLPAGLPSDVTLAPNATVFEFVPHGPVLDRAVCAVTHGGMGATQKALARGVPVCVVPFGRDQFEVARRVEVARCGTRLPAKKLTAARLSANVRQAMTMTDGARRSRRVSQRPAASPVALTSSSNACSEPRATSSARASRAVPVLAESVVGQRFPTWSTDTVWLMPSDLRFCGGAGRIRSGPHGYAFPVLTMVCGYRGGPSAISGHAVGSAIMPKQLPALGLFRAVRRGALSVCWPPAAPASAPTVASLSCSFAASRGQQIPAGKHTYFADMQRCWALAMTTSPWSDRECGNHEQTTC